jgi:hypothetical protein
MEDWVATTPSSWGVEMAADPTGLVMSAIVGLGRRGSYTADERQAMLGTA